MLDGSRSEDLRSTVWGEQVITYVGSEHRANHRRFPGVSPTPSVCHPSGRREPGGVGVVLGLQIPDALRRRDDGQQ